MAFFSPVPFSAKEPLAEKIKQTLGVQNGLHNIFGDPIEKKGLTLIPVGTMRVGFGLGKGNSKRGQGVGGGGGANFSPLGYIEIKRGKSRFRPIRDSNFFFKMFIGAGLGMWLALKGFRSQTSKPTKW